MKKILKIEITILIFSVVLFLVSIYYIKTLNLIFNRLGASKEGWNVYPPSGALNNRELQNSIDIDTKLVFFEIVLFISICFISIDIYRKITK